MKIEKYDLLKSYRNLTREYKGYQQPRSQVFKPDGRYITEKVPTRQNQNVKRKVVRMEASKYEKN